MRLIFLFSVVFLFVHCKNEWIEIEKLQREVEAIHDEPMAKMDRLEHFQKLAAKEFSTTDSTDLSKKMRRDSLGNFIVRCQKANDAMFDWMAQYRAPDAKKDAPRAATAYLFEQKKLAEAMRLEVLSAIGEGERFLGNSKK